MIREDKSNFFIKILKQIRTDQCNRESAWWICSIIRGTWYLEQKQSNLYIPLCPYFYGTQLSQNLIAYSSDEPKIWEQIHMIAETCVATNHYTTISLPSLFTYYSIPTTIIKQFRPFGGKWAKVNFCLFLKATRSRFEKNVG